MNISEEKLKEYRKLSGEGMISALGEYTPSEFVELLDYINYLKEELRKYEQRNLEEICPNCGKDYFVEETIVDGELSCSCARR